MPTYLGFYRAANLALCLSNSSKYPRLFGAWLDIIYCTQKSLLIAPPLGVVDADRQKREWEQW